MHARLHTHGQTPQLPPQSSQHPLSQGLKRSSSSAVSPVLSLSCLLALAPLRAWTQTSPSARHGRLPTIN